MREVGAKGRRLTPLPRRVVIVGRRGGGFAALSDPLSEGGISGKLILKQAINGSCDRLRLCTVKRHEVHQLAHMCRTEPNRNLYLF